MNSIIQSQLDTLADTLDEMDEVVGKIRKTMANNAADFAEAQQTLWALKRETAVSAHLQADLDAVQERLDRLETERKELRDRLRGTLQDIRALAAYVEPGA